MHIMAPVRGSKTAVIKGVWTSMDVHGLEIGGEGGIRTLGARKGTPHFECGTIDHSATSPQKTFRGLVKARSVGRGRASNGFVFGWQAPLRLCGAESGLN